MSNTNLLKDYTIALDSGGKVIYCEKTTFIIPHFFEDFVSEATTIIVGDNANIISPAFWGHNKVRKIYVYSDTAARNISSQNEAPYYISTTDENTAEIEVIDEDDVCELLTPNSSTNELCVSDFGAKGDGVTDDTNAINLAVAYVLYKGGELVFRGDNTYAISSPIMICSPNNISSPPKFDINFNHATITLVYEKKWIVDSYYSYEETTPVFNPIPFNAMIYVNTVIVDKEKSGTIQNVKLYPGICKADYYDKMSGNYTHTFFRPKSYTGIYCDSTSYVNYRNIKILDTTRGIYIAEKYDANRNKHVLMDNIHISKYRNGSTSLLDGNRESETDNAYKNSTLVGIDCNADECELSNIIVIDHLIGMRVIGEKNNVYGAHIWNTYCPQQYKHSVGFINGGKSGSTTDNPENIYTACVADKFHIGWLSSDTANFTLKNCHWYNKEVKINGVVYENEAYGFYIPDDIVEYYEDNEIGSNITAVDCYMVGSDLDNDNCFTNFCNRKDHSINYTGTTSNVFYAPIPKKEVEAGNIQYGKIRSIPITISNSSTEKFNVYNLTPNDFSNGINGEGLTFNGYGDIIDNKVNILGNNGTITNQNGAHTKVTLDEDGEVLFSITSPPNTSYGWDQIQIDLNHLGYSVGDAGCISFEYFSNPETKDATKTPQIKQFFINHNYSIREYFADESVQSEQSILLTDDGQWHTFSYVFKIHDLNSMKFTIGHGEKGNNTKVNTNDIKVKNIRVIKIPAELDLKNLPKYYLETESNYEKRVANAFSSKNSTITKNASNCDVLTIPAYSQSNPVYQRYGAGSKLSFVSLPFKHTVTDNQGETNVPEYKLRYSKLGRPCFTGLLKEDLTVLVNPEINIEYTNGTNTKLFVFANYPYFEYEQNKYTVESDNRYIGKIINKDTNTDLLNLYVWSNLQNINLIPANTTLTNKIVLPLYKLDTTDSTSNNDKSYVLSNFIVNPSGYHFESPVDAVYSENESAYIPIYKYSNEVGNIYGEIRLIMKNAEYSTDLPTVFLDIQNSAPQVSDAVDS